MSTKHQKSMQASGKSDNGQEMKVVHQEAYQGPLPHPDLLKKFEDITPGAAERILLMAEKEQQHRHQLENEILIKESENIKNEIELKGRGLIFGFLLALLIIIAGVYLLIFNKSLEGFSLILGSIAMIITPFFFNKTNNQK
ncbi:DUF2335 domain-containing protein [Cetobacterium sp. 2A]|uniref:DUF2335 domain-containing protein n=1 Tax=Cetobacterium sp. 2A TaxID=2754723 RepID=UPI00163BD38D|nr:DUF2335 domain-containing protein [Cetobacterium sp. 2A]